MPRKLWLILIAVGTTISSSARAQTLAASYLALCHRDWACEESLQVFDGLPVIRVGWLEHTFGKACGCVDTVLQDERPKEVRVHIANGPCLRNKRCGRYEIFHGFTIASANRNVRRPRGRVIKRFTSVLSRLKGRLSRARGPLTCYVSPVLESDLNVRARKILLRLTSSYLPGCVLVDNPLRGNCIRGTVCERHGPNPGLAAPCVSDLDGISAREVSVANFATDTKDCDLSFIWLPEFNCNQPHSQTFTDPRKRNCGHPSAAYEDLAMWLHREFR